MQDVSKLSALTILQSLETRWLADACYSDLSMDCSCSVLSTVIFYAHVSIIIITINIITTGM